MGTSLSKEQKYILFAYAKKEQTSPQIHKPESTFLDFEGNNDDNNEDRLPNINQQNENNPHNNNSNNNIDRSDENIHELDPIQLQQLEQRPHHQNSRLLFMRLLQYTQKSSSTVAPEQSSTMSSSSSSINQTNQNDSAAADGKPSSQNLENREPQNEDDLCLEYSEEGDLVPVPYQNIEKITMGELQSLESLGLCSQALLKLSVNIGLLTQTTTLQLCCNNINFIPPEIGYMKNLKYLSLAKNQIDDLPETIGCLKKLVELKLSQNRLTKLPSSIQFLKKLKFLYADHNLINKLPSELGHLEKLILLDVSYNPLTTLPAELIELKDLRRIKVDNCPLIILFPTTTHIIPSLKELSARIIARHHVPILNIASQQTKDYLASAHTCSFCQGPYFEYYVPRYRWVEKNEVRLHFEYRLCSIHWNTEQERVSAMFKPIPDTAPNPIDESRFVPTPPVQRRFNLSRQLSIESVTESSSSHNLDRRNNLSDPNLSQVVNVKTNFPSSSSNVNNKNSHVLSFNKLRSLSVRERQKSDDSVSNTLASTLKSMILKENITGDPDNNNSCSTGINTKTKRNRKGSVGTQVEDSDVVSIPFSSLPKSPSLPELLPLSSSRERSNSLARLIFTRSTMKSSKSFFF